MQFSRILVRAANWVGDAVMSIPALEAIRTRFPGAHVAILARPWVAGIYGRSLVDEIIPYTAARGWRDLNSKWRLARELAKRRFDCAILLQNAFEAAALVWTARIPRRIGYNRDGRGWLLTDAIAVPRPGEIPRHERFYYLELLRRAGIVDTLPESSEIRIGDAQQFRDAGRCRLGGDVVGVAPGAAYGGAKRWLPERFAEAAVEVARELSAPVVLFGSPEERELCNEVARAISSAGCQVRNLAGETSIAEFVELAAACRVFLTNDSGAMHIASALGVPTVAVFGATDDAATGPAGPMARVVREPVECSPCLLRECPIDHRCMTRVPASRVTEAALELVQVK